MDGATGMLIKLGVRLAVFGLVFFIAARRNPKIVIPVKWATPLVALVFAILNTTLYWGLRPVLDLATLGALGFAMPLIVNIILLVVTVKFFAWHKLPRFISKVPVNKGDPKKKSEQSGEARPLFVIEGLFATLWMALILTAAHGVLWVALDYIPSK
ncbi:MAG: hypothetical protein H0V17_30250 [Deltaproteobacteria bacterium]|nr:hypothetical protein [Deltaproteobacteria bacterium]